MNFTEQQIKEKISNALGDIWAVKFIESSEWSNHPDVWTEYYDNEEEAMKSYNDTNKQNKFDDNNVPDYYIIARKPVKVNWTLILTD